jgi:hypothetical protein
VSVKDCGNQWKKKRRKKVEFRIVNFILKSNETTLPAYNLKMDSVGDVVVVGDVGVDGVMGGGVLGVAIVASLLDDVSQGQTAGIPVAGSGGSPYLLKSYDGSFSFTKACRSSMTMILSSFDRE